MVDVFLFTADNISETAMAREQRHPQSESLARLMINIQYRTAEVLLSPHRGMEIKPKKCDRNPKGRQEVRYAHSTKEAANHSGGKGCTLYSSK